MMIMKYLVLHIKKSTQSIDILSYGAQGRTRTGTVLRPTDFESVASTNFATWALVECEIIILSFL